MNYKRNQLWMHIDEDDKHETVSVSGLLDLIHVIVLCFCALFDQFI